ncbi:MAG: phosphoribosylformylglycinamidine synthase subunit PurS [Bacteroidota bacterium]
MKFIAEIDVMPLKELLDPEGKTVVHHMKDIELTGVEDVRIGKHITMTIDAESEQEATDKVELACKKILANPVMEFYQFTVNAG